MFSGASLGAFDGTEHPSQIRLRRRKDQGSISMVDEIQATGGNYRPERLTPIRRANVRMNRPGEGRHEPDRVEISELAYWRARIASLPEARAQKVAAVRTQLADNSYETTKKWEVAIDQLVHDLNEQI